MILIFCGIPGTGKSTVAGKLAQRLEELDQSYKLFVSDQVSDKTYEKVFRFLENNIDEVKYLVVDATFYREKWRDRVQKIAEEHSEKLLTIYLYCSLETCLERNCDRDKGVQVSEKVVHIIQNEIEAPESPDLQVNTEEIEPQEVVEKILREAEIS